MAQLLTIAQLGAAVIRTIATPIEAINLPETQQLVDDLLATVADAKGMGIAAPQVGVSKRLVIVCCQPNERYPYAPEMPPTPMFNPEIIEHSDAMKKDWEGCLSLPGIRAEVPRYESIRVAYASRSGERLEQSFTGFLARVVQHELDHLDGIVFIFRVETTRDIIMEQEWRKRIAARPPLLVTD